MLSGQRAFRGDTAADTITAILTKEPPDLSQTNKDIHPGLDRIVRHCLEKNPEERFESARDVAFDLEALSSVSAPTTGAVAAPRGRRRRRAGSSPALVAAAVALAAGASAATAPARRPATSRRPTIQQLTFRRGELYSARFAPDGQTVIYAAAWDGKPVEIFVDAHRPPRVARLRPRRARTSWRSRRPARWLVSLDRHVDGAVHPRAARSREVGVSGGVAPREILEGRPVGGLGARTARSLAVVRDVSLRNQLEFPIGKVLYQTAGWISHPRVSRRRRRSSRSWTTRSAGDDGGTVAVVDRAGKKTDARPTAFSSEYGLAWSPERLRDLVHGGAKVGGNRALYAVSLVRRRAAARPGDAEPDAPGRVAATGAMLVAHDTIRIGILAGGAGTDEGARARLARLVVALRPLRRRQDDPLLGDRRGRGARVLDVHPAAPTARPPVRLGDGGGSGALAGRPVGRGPGRPRDSGPLTLYPTGAGEKRGLSRPAISSLRAAASSRPTASSLVFTANEPGHGSRIYVRRPRRAASRAR